MEKTIGDFLIELSVNPELLDDYWNDPEGVVRDRSGLSTDKQEIVLTNDPSAIVAALEEEYPGEHLDWAWRPIRVLWQLSRPPKPIKRIDY